MDGHNKNFFKVHTLCVNFSQQHLFIVRQMIITRDSQRELFENHIC